MKKKRKMSYEKKKQLTGIIFLAPWLIGFIYFFTIPLFQSAIYSLSDISIETTGIMTKFVGFKHYISAFRQDPDFIRYLVGSVGKMLYQVPLIIVLSLFIATIINQKFVGRSLVRAMFFLPVLITTGVIISILKGDMLTQTDAYANMLLSGSRSSGLFSTFSLNTVFLELGIMPETVNMFMTFINNIFELCWKSGVQILLFLSGLQTVGPDLYEASKIEGATPWETFWKITFPMISPIIILNIVYTIIDNFSDYYNQVMLYISVIARNLDISTSAALSWIYFLIQILIISIVYVILNRRTFYMVR